MWVFAFLAISMLAAALWPMVSRTAYGPRSEEEKYNARRAYAWAEGTLMNSGKDYTVNDVLRLATHMYFENFDTDMKPPNLNQFIKTWAVIHPEPDFRCHNRWGPPERMSDEECAKCIEELRAGYVMDNQRFGWTSLDHAAQHPDLCPTVAECRRRYSERREDGMWLRLEKYDSNLIHIKPSKCSPLTDEVKAERVSSCKDYLDKLEENPDFLKRIFFIDQKTYFMQPKLGWVIGYKTDEEDWVVGMKDITNYNAITHRQDIVEVQTYTMVNWYGGVCGFHICQGTTGARKIYRVCELPSHGTPGVGCLAVHMHPKLCLRLSPTQNCCARCSAAARSSPHVLLPRKTLHLCWPGHSCRTLGSFCGWGHQLEWPAIAAWGKI